MKNFAFGKSFPVLKRLLANSSACSNLRRSALLILQMWFANGALAATDFEALYAEMRSGQQHIEKLESSLGRYSYQLLEPLEHLARIQFEANRFDEAQQTTERAIQIARFSEGLYAREQYRLLELEIDISRKLADWKETDSQLAHYTYLLGNRYEGSSQEKLLALDWLADKHLQCALETTPEYRAKFLILATTINEFAVQYAQLTQQTDSEIYGELLYGLTTKYFVEARGILGDSDSSYKLRLVDPNLTIIEKKSTAIEKRYQVGLEKLVMLRNALATQQEPDTEALGMVELYIADWKLAFNDFTDVSTEYAAARTLLREAGISDERLERFFARPAIIPSSTFSLDFDQALAALERDSKIADDTWQLSIFENSAKLPGYVAASANDSISQRTMDDWNTIALTLELDPATGSRFNSRGYFTRSNVIPGNIRVVDAGNLSDRFLNALLDRVQAVSFRPVLHEGTPVAAAFAVHYSFQNEPGSEEIDLTSSIAQAVGD